MHSLRRRSRLRHSRIGIERLETRLTPSTWQVTDLSPSAPGGIIAAVASANSDTSPATISFDGALSGGTITLAGMLNLSNSSQPVTILGPAGGITFKGGGSLSNFSLFHLVAGATVTFDGLTMTDGHTSGGGGAITSDSTLILKNCTFTNNVAEVYGGAVYSNGPLNMSDCTFTTNSVIRPSGTAYGGAVISWGPDSITRCTFNSNTATGTSGEFGGALNLNGSSTVTASIFNNNTNNHYGCAIASWGTLTLIQSEFTSNTGTGGGRGAVWGKGAVIADSCTFTNNFNATGGALAIEGSPSSITNSTFTGNKALSGIAGAALILGETTISFCDFKNNFARDSGGAINLQQNASVVMDGCTLDNNFSGIGGGGIANFGQKLSIINSTISNNTADGSNPSIGFDGSSGGGVSSHRGTTTIVNSTLAQNFAAGTATGAGGGGIYVQGDTTTLPVVVVTNTTIAGNVAFSGGGVMNAPDFKSTYGLVTLNNSIIAKNVGGDVAGGSVSGANTLVADGSVTVGITNMLTGDPLLGSLADNGGRTLTMKLLSGSPARDAGDNSLAVDWVPNPLATDQRGQPRIANATVDLGAFEATPDVEGLVVTTLDDSNVPADGKTSLREALIVAATNPGPDTVTFAGGLTGSILLSSALPTLNQDVTIQGPGAKVITVTTGSMANFSLFTVETARIAVVSGLTLAGGHGTEDGKGNTGGGAIVNSGTLTVSNCILANNAASLGGGILNFGDLTVQNTTFSKNTATTFAGGGIYNNGGSMALSDCTIALNQAPYGAGVYTHSPDIVTFTRCTFTQNGANNDGGGIYSESAVNISDSVFNDCYAVNGGGVFLETDPVTSVVTTTTFASNDAIKGGGLYADAGALIRVDRSTFNDNVATNSGGAIWNKGTAWITNSTLYANSSANGGGVFQEVGSGPMKVTNSTFWSNTYTPGTSFGGGALYVATGAGSVTLNNNLMAQNWFANMGGESAWSILGTVNPASANNLIGTLDTDPSRSGGLKNGVNGNIVGELSDYGVGLFGNNGGPTATLPLLTGSPALNVGSNALAVDPDGAALTTDQRGQQRISAGSVDIGAFELQVVLRTPTVTVSAKGGQYLSTPYAATSMVAGNDNVFGPTLEGVAPESRYYIGTTPTGAYTTTAPSAAGTYTVVAFFPGSANYESASSDPATFAITTAPLSIQPGPRTKTYGQVVTFDPTNFTSSGLLGSDTITGITQTSAGAAANAPVSGSPYDIVGSNAVGAGLANYTITYQTGVLKVNAAALTVTANDAVRILGQPYPTLTAKIEGFVAGDDSTDLGGTLLFSTTEPQNPPPGQYTITPSGLTSTNYTIAFVDGTLTVKAAPAPSQLYAVGADSGGGPHVKVYNTDGSLRFEFFAYEAAFTGGVRVATGDLDGDGTADIVTAAGPSGGPHVKVFSGADQTLLGEFFAYEAAFTGGVFVAVGDVNNDGQLDIITGADAGGGPHVRVFDPIARTMLHEFFAYDAAFHGGVRVASGDVNGDGFDDVITGAGATGGPHVRAFSGNDLAVLREFFAYEASNTHGVYVAAGDVDNDGKDDIITGTGAGESAQVKAFSGADGSELRSIMAYDQRYHVGARVGSIDLNGDGFDDIITGAGPVGGPHQKVFNGQSLDVLQERFCYDPSFTGGIFVG